MAAADSSSPVLDTIRLGDEIPDLPFRTDQGASSLREFEKDKWLLLFSYPKDMTPVCATEMAELARRHAEFEARGIKLLGVCVGTIDEHKDFVADVETTFGVTIRFPVIADEDRTVVSRLGLIHPRMRGTGSGRHSIRSVVVASPVDAELEGEGRQAELVLHYPPHIGRDTGELLRCMDALLRSHADDGIGTPANWQAGQDVVLLPSVTDEEARVRAEEAGRGAAPGAEADGAAAAGGGFSALTPYIRLVPDPGLPSVAEDSS